MCLPLRMAAVSRNLLKHLAKSSLATANCERKTDFAEIAVASLPRDVVFCKIALSQMPKFAHFLDDLWSFRIFLHLRGEALISRNYDAPLARFLSNRLFQMSKFTDFARISSLLFGLFERFCMSPAGEDFDVLSFTIDRSILSKFPRF